MNAISRALKKGEAAKTTVPTSPKTRKRGRTAVDGPDSTQVAKQHLSVREGGDIDLGMLDQEAFARVIASGQQPGISPLEHIEPAKDVVEEADEEEGAEVTDDVTYRPSGVPDGADPIWSLRMTCLPVLDILSTEILKVLSSHQHSTILQIVTGSPASPVSHNYAALLHLFDATKKQLYSEDQAFLDPDVLGFKEMQERKVIRKANLATFISSVFGSVDVGFFHLNEGFVTTMAPDGGRLLKDMARLFLDLKTQAYISAMGQPSRDQTSILNDLFPSTAQLTHLFVGRRSIGPLTSVPTHEDLTPTEIEFISKCDRRRELLRSHGDDDKQVATLKDNYSWETFLRELRSYIAKSWETIVVSRGGKPRRPGKKRTSAGIPTFIPEGAAATGFGTTQVTSPTVAQGAGELPTALPADSEQVAAQPIWEAYEKARMTSIPASAVGPAGSTMGTSATGIPPPATSSAKPAKGTPRPTSEGNQVRRPWTKEEENALFAGLEAVQGPNWAAILQLYGPGGSISEALKDRSQVQLKDKARNLKLFFLKTGHPVPLVLQRVTGTIKGEGSPATGEATQGRRRKKRKTTAEEAALMTPPPVGTAAQGDFPLAGWSQTGEGGQEFAGVVGQNVDPGLQMPQGT